jgi:hypothetical protein
VECRQLGRGEQAVQVASIQAGASFDDAVSVDCRFTVTGHDQQAHARSMLPQFGRQLRHGHVRHDDVAQDEVEASYPPAVKTVDLFEDFRMRGELTLRTADEGVLDDASAIDQEYGRPRDVPRRETGAMPDAVRPQHVAGFVDQNVEWEA